MHTKKIEFENRRGHRLAARLDLPADDDPVAYALFAHCFTCSKDLRAAANISQALAARGFGVLRFDFTGLGESEGDFSETNFSANADDITAASEMLARQYQSPEVMIGHSLGGAAVLRAAGKVRSVKAVATIGAPFDPRHVAHLFEESVEQIEETGFAIVNIGGRPFRIERQFIQDLASQNPTDYIRRLDRALLILHAPLDQIVGVENAAKIFEAAKHPKSFVSLDTADHLLTEFSDSAYAGDVVAAWAGRYVREQREVKHLDPADNRVVARIGKDRFRTDILANGHNLISDEPRSVGGGNAGPTPYDLVAAGLGACTAMTLRMYADRKQWQLDGVTVELLHSKVHAEDCDCETTATGKIDKIERGIVLDGSLTDEQRGRLIEIANRCPVHRSLEGDIIVNTKVLDE